MPAAPAAPPPPPRLGKLDASLALATRSVSWKSSSVASQSVRAFAVPLVGLAVCARLILAATAAAACCVEAEAAATRLRSPGVSEGPPPRRSTSALRRATSVWRRKTSATRARSACFF